MFFNQSLIDILFKASPSIRCVKKYFLIFEIAILGVENRFLFIVFLDSYLIVCTSQI